MEDLGISGKDLARLALEVVLLDLGFEETGWIGRDGLEDSLLESGFVGTTGREGETG